MILNKKGAIELIESLKKIVQLTEELEGLTSNLHGMKITFEGNYAVINHVNISDMTVDLYIEYENGDSEFMNIGIGELLGLKQ